MEAKIRVRKLVLFFIVLSLILVPTTAMAGGGAGGFGNKGEDPDGWARPEPDDGLDGLETDPLIDDGGSDSPSAFSVVGYLLWMTFSTL